jgi:hypothetical protein
LTAGRTSPSSSLTPGSSVTPGTATARTPTTPEGSGPSGDAALNASFRKLQAKLHSRSLGLAYQPLGDTHLVQLGDWETGPAWSTVKVPLSVAALRRSSSDEVVSLVHRAITESDNSAAEALWGVLGGGQPAATAVDAVLASYGDRSTHTQSRQIRPPFTPFGQTTWSLTHQVTFMSRLYCSADASSVIQEMNHISAGQRWGLGTLPGATFKGGWGPDTSGRYLVRQFGVVTLGRARVAVAVSVEPGSGSFSEGTRDLDQIATWLRKNVHPTSGSC